MSKIRLYLDEDTIEKALIKALRDSDIDTLTTSEADNLSRSDLEQLIYATQQERVIYTYNTGDFCRLHNTYLEQGIDHSGIIVAGKQNFSIGEQLRGMLRLIEGKSAQAMRNQLVFIGVYIREN